MRHDGPLLIRSDLFLCIKSDPEAKDDKAVKSDVAGKPVADFENEIMRRGHSASILDTMALPSPFIKHEKRKHRSHHKHHHHARHLRNAGLNSQDTLENRIRSGMQTLEEERKAIRGIVTEIEEECDVNEREDITSK